MNFPLQGLFEHLSSISPPDYQTLDPRVNPPSSSNDPLTKNERLVASISSVRKYRSAILQAEEGIKNLLEYVSREASKAAAYIQEYESRAAPIASLPTEVLTEVFLGVRRLEYAEIGDIYYAKQDVKSIPPPITAQVCRLWRDLSLAIPRLWARISVDRPPPHEQRGTDNNLQLAKLFLKRSGSAPLTMSIRTDTWCPLTFELIQTSNAERWERVQLWLAEMFFRKADVFSAEARLPQLLACSMAILSSTPNHIDYDALIGPPKSISFRQAPNLQLLTLSDRSEFTGKGMRLDVPFHQLFSLRAICGIFSRRELANIFLGSQNLRRCHFLGPLATGHGDEESIEPVSSHPTLDTVLISFAVPRFIASHLPLSLPNIRNLSFTNLAAGIEPHSPDVLPLFERWGLQLQTVIFPELNLTPTMQTCLEHCRNLTTLAFIYNRDQTFQSIPPPPSKTQTSRLSALQHLDTLAFGIVNLDQAEWSIETAKAINRPLRLKLYVSLGWIPEAENQSQTIAPFNKLSSRREHNLQIDVLFIQTDWGTDWQLMCNHVRTGEWQ